jgi:hypothetical protein
MSIYAMVPPCKRGYPQERVSAREGIRKRGYHIHKPVPNSLYFSNPHVYPISGPHFELSFILPHVEHVHHCLSIFVPQNEHCQVAGTAALGVAVDVDPPLVAFFELGLEFVRSTTVLARFDRFLFSSASF